MNKKLKVTFHIPLSRRPQWVINIIATSINYFAELREGETPGDKFSLISREIDSMEFTERNSTYKGTILPRVIEDDKMTFSTKNSTLIATLTYE